MVYRDLSAEAREALFRQSWQQAIMRVGSTPETKAQWLLDVGYQQASFYDLSDEQVYTLRWEMVAFLVNTVDFESNPGLTVSRDEAHRWLKLLQEGVKELTKGRWWRLKSAMRCSFRVPLDGSSPEVYSRVDDDDMQKKLIEVLLAVQGRLRRCQRPKCDRLFVAHKRQEYCQKSCSNKVRISKYRSKLGRAGASVDAC